MLLIYDFIINLCLLYVFALVCVPYFVTKSKVKEQDLYTLDLEIARTYKRRYKLQQKKQRESNCTISDSNSDTGHFELESFEEMVAS